MPRPRRCEHSYCDKNATHLVRFAASAQTGSYCPAHSTLVEHAFVTKHTRPLTPRERATPLQRQARLTEEDAA